MTTATTTTLFPTVEDFNKKVEKRRSETAVAWKDLMVETVYKILSTRKIEQTRFGNSAMIIRMCTVDGREISVWATSLIMKDLTEMQLPCFVKPLGLQQCKKDEKRSYHAYQLLTMAELLN